MKNKMKQLFGIILSLVLALGLMPGMKLTAYAAEYANGETVVRSALQNGDILNVGTIVQQDSGQMWNADIYIDNVMVGTAGYNGGTYIMTKRARFDRAANGKLYFESITAVTGITLDKDSATINVGDTEPLTLTATVLPDDAADKTIQWTTSDGKVATVTGGIVTAVKEGTTIITATATNGTDDTSDDVTATCTVTVGVPAYNISINPTQHGTVEVSNTLAKAGERVTVTAKPDAKYRLKSITGIYQETPRDTFYASSWRTNNEGAYFTSYCNNVAAIPGSGTPGIGWRLSNGGGFSAPKLEISANDSETKIDKVVMTVAGADGKDKRKNDMLNTTAGAFVFDSNDPSSIVTIKDIDSSTVQVSCPNADIDYDIQLDESWFVTSVTIYGSDVTQKDIAFAETNEENVYTFEMPEEPVTIIAEFEAASSDSGSGSSSSGSSDNTNTNTDTSAKVPYEDVAISTGSVKDITGTAAATAESNPFETKIVNSSELKTLLSLTDAEVAQGVNVWLDIQDLSASVSQTDKTLIQNTSGDYTVGLYLDINLFKKVGSNDATKVTETNGAVKASILIPESLWKSGRTFEIIRVHDGVATAIAGTYDENTHVFTFETDKFSTYALAYKDPASSSNSGTTSNSSNSLQSTAPKTGESNDIRVWYLLLIASLGGLGFLGYSKKKKVNE
ncbi:MAG: hypothetical protein E7281_02370 [Lachnospiraceae bacterium]|nr:hypothetical protein [Lachnospiraceae bacterium]